MTNTKVKYIKTTDEIIKDIFVSYDLEVTDNVLKAARELLKYYQVWIFDPIVTPIGDL